tara:strand:- start:1098 stop:1277 length:180 start_codon:yes stop_codon:yes gene_type:complete
MTGPFLGLKFLVAGTPFEGQEVKGAHPKRPAGSTTNAPARYSAAPNPLFSLVNVTLTAC